jgi:DNA-binding CsgD family transcriptional regulator
LDAAAQLYPQARVLAGAARCWLRVLAGHIDPEEVSTAARRLHAIGHAWDASRLAGQAAVRAEDRAVMTGLLSCARSLRPAGTSTVADPGPGPEAGPARHLAAVGSLAAAEPTVLGHQAPITPRSGDHPGLSEREREVAALFVEGLTYKEIGARLFISAKTVEHHVARIRHRCGATSRGDLFARLRVALSQCERT